MEELGRGPPLPGVEFGQCSDFFSFFVLTFVCLFFLLVLFCLFFRIFYLHSYCKQLWSSIHICLLCTKNSTFEAGNWLNFP